MMFEAKTMKVCARCGNKRCPHATDENMTCTRSNEPGQVGTPSEKLPKNELKRFFDMCLAETSTLNKDDYVGFIVGFRMYERIAIKLGRQITVDESMRVVPKLKCDDPQCWNDDSLQPPLESDSAAHIESVARKAWQTYCHFEGLGSRIDTVAKFDGYAVKISIKPTQASRCVEPSLGADIMAANQEGIDSRQPKQACEDCLYTGKLCPECLTEWERANREV